MRSGLAFAFLFLLFPTLCRLGAEPEPIPVAEALAPPTSGRLAALAKAGRDGHWEAVAKLAGVTALGAYEKEKWNVAESWHYVQRWASLFGETESRFIPRWIAAVQNARVGHANMAMKYAMSDRLLGDALAPELQRWVLGNSAFSDEFFTLLASVDYIPQVFAALDEIHRTHAGRFQEYASLALAIAVVYDLPPPPDWPHGQVSATALPRRWPARGEAFAWWMREDKAGRTYQRLARLGADELKFVVDASAPFSELEWAQRTVGYPLDQLARAYTMIRYRSDRVQSQETNWPANTYALSDVLREGGICCDQAYFATQIGKARGVPTLLFRGTGLDGRHAWFGFLDGNQKWLLDAGRYAEQRFVTGLAYDPQTWRILSDHELKFISERFRALPSYRQSRIHAVFAQELLRAGRAEEAAASGQKAVNYERRNLDAWEALLAAQQAQGVKPVVREATLREAAFAFARYPDLEISFLNRSIKSLRDRGETSLAEFEEGRLTRKYQADRNDLSIRQAAEIIQRSFSKSIGEQITAYHAALDKFGHGAGIEFFDKIVVVFAEHLLQLNERTAAVKAVERARRTLKVEPGRQLDQEFDRLLKILKEARQAEGLG